MVLFSFWSVYDINVLSQPIFLENGDVYGIVLVVLQNAWNFLLQNGVSCELRDMFITHVHFLLLRLNGDRTLKTIHVIANYACLL